MTPPLSIGSQVLVAGPDSSGQCDWIGAKFKIERKVGKDGNYYTAPGVPLFLASSLRLVEEELKIGDWVEVIGPDGGYCTRPDDPKVFRVTGISSEGNLYGDMIRPGYPAESLRKLTPEEVQQIGKFTPEKRLDSLEEYARDNDRRLSAIEKGNEIVEEYLRKCVDKRLEAIEKRLKEDRNLMTEIEGRVDERVDEIEEDLDKIFKRLQVLEGERPEVIDSKKSTNGRITCPNARFAPQQKCMFCGEGMDLCHDNLHRGECPFLDGMREG
jgi:hypothetical protein